MTQHCSPVGCAFFSNNGSLSSGGFASAGGGEAFRFSSLETLQARGPLWVVSMPESTFLTEGGRNYPFLRHAGFMGTPVTAIAQELGASGAATVPVAVQRVSEVLTRVGEMSQLLRAEGLSLAGDAGSQTLVSVFQGVVAPPLRHEDMPKDLLDAMPSMFKAPGPMGSPSPNDIAVRIPANRLRLAQIVLDAAVPAGDWTEVAFDDYPSPESALSWAIGHRAPVLCYVTIRGPLPKIKATAPLLRNLTAGATRWMALPEVVALSRLVDIVPKRIFLANELVAAQASLKIPPPVFSPAATASISAGLFAEAYMHAVCSTSALQQSDSGMQAPQVYSVRAAWLTAVARSVMLQEATALAEKNFSVIGLGLSHVIVAVSRRHLEPLRKAIEASHLLSYPTGLRAMEEPMPRVRESHEIALADGSK